MKFSVLGAGEELWHGMVSVFLPWGQPSIPRALLHPLCCSWEGKVWFLGVPSPLCAGTAPLLLQIQVLAGRGADGFADDFAGIWSPKAGTAPSPESPQGGLPPPDPTQPTLGTLSSSSVLNSLISLEFSSRFDAVSLPPLQGRGCSIPVFSFPWTPQSRRVPSAVASGRRQRATAARR